mmetsp:Transcript_38092/g.108185  ORF Transcript_38092/g.108185 Transcript_38092/m.108185 type:complete len:200 (-) Transcript_38092:15-614(-)
MPATMPDIMSRFWRQDNSTSHLSYNSSYKLPPPHNSVTIRKDEPNVQAPTSFTRFGCSNASNVSTSLQKAICCFMLKRLLFRYVLIATGLPSNSPAKMSAASPATKIRSKTKEWGSISKPLPMPSRSAPNSGQETPVATTASKSHLPPCAHDFEWGTMNMDCGAVSSAFGGTTTQAPGFALRGAAGLFRGIGGGKGVMA